MVRRELVRCGVLPAEFMEGKTFVEVREKLIEGGQLPKGMEQASFEEVRTALIDKKLKMKMDPINSWFTKIRADLMSDKLVPWGFRQANFEQLVQHLKANFPDLKDMKVDSAKELAKVLLEHGMLGPPRTQIARMWVREGMYFQSLLKQIASLED